MKIQLLTRREREIIEMIVEGRQPFKTVALNLKISINTAHIHIKSIYRKWGVRCLSELIYSYNEENLWMIRKNPNAPSPAPFTIIRRDEKVFRINKTETLYQLKKAA